jgi:hypothetical protein
VAGGIAGTANPVATPGRKKKMPAMIISTSLLARIIAVASRQAALMSNVIGRFLRAAVSRRLIIVFPAGRQTK